jgi:hypothetical protein
MPRIAWLRLGLSIRQVPFLYVEYRGREVWINHAPSLCEWRFAIPMYVPDHCLAVLFSRCLIFFFVKMDCCEGVSKKVMSVCTATY